MNELGPAHCPHTIHSHTHTSDPPTSLMCVSLNQRVVCSGPCYGLLTHFFLKGYPTVVMIYLGIPTVSTNVPHFKYLFSIFDMDTISFIYFHDIITVRVNIFEICLQKKGPWVFAVEFGCCQRVIVGEDIHLWARQIGDSMLTLAASDSVSGCLLAL